MNDFQIISVLVELGSSAQKSDIVKTLNMLRLRVFEQPRLAPDLLLRSQTTNTDLGASPLNSLNIHAEPLHKLCKILDIIHSSLNSNYIARRSKHYK